MHPCDPPAILAWFQQHPLPHCQNLASLPALRSGVAIAEVLTQKLPTQLHRFFLPKIEIYNLTPQRCIQNLKVLLGTLRNVMDPTLLEEFTAEGLYFDHNMMESFVVSVLMRLSPQPLLKQSFRDCRQFQDLSDIANLSSIIAPQQARNQDLRSTLKQINNNGQDFKSSTSQCRENAQKEPQDKRENPNQSERRVERICFWLQDKHHTSVEKSSPEEIIASVVNSVFAGSRLDQQQIIKSSHLEMGSAVVFRKAGEYLLTCERMPKHNVLAMLEEVEVGCVREEVFWRLLEDIMNIQASHARKIRKSNKNVSQNRKKPSRVPSSRVLTPSNKENHDKLIAAETERAKPVVGVQQPSKETIQAAEQWICRDLGYEHSLCKSKAVARVEENPLLNGVLLGSIVMRLQLGKVNINKEPKSKAEVSRNLNEVASCLIRRGIEAGRRLSKVAPSYQAYLSVIWAAKQELDQKQATEKTRRAQNEKLRFDPSQVVSQQEREELAEWVSSRGKEIASSGPLPPSVLSEVVGQALQLRLLRETTPRIREANLSKIMEECRRLGWDCQCGVEGLLNQSSEVRWRLLRFVVELVRHKVYYFR